LQDLIWRGKASSAKYCFFNLGVELGQIAAPYSSMGVVIRAWQKTLFWEAIRESRTEHLVFFVVYNYFTGFQTNWVFT